MSSHNFNCDGELDEVSHFVSGFKYQMKDTVQSDLADLNQFCAAKIFSHQHAEHGRAFWVFKRSGSQMNAGAVRASRKIKLNGTGTIFGWLRQTQHKNHLFAGELVDFINTRSNQAGFQFVSDLTQKGTIQCHENRPFYLYLILVVIRLGDISLYHKMSKTARAWSAWQSDKISKRNKMQFLFLKHANCDR